MSYRNHASSDAAAAAEGPNALQLNELIVDASQDLLQELVKFQRTLKIIRDMFVDAGINLGLSSQTVVPYVHPQNTVDSLITQLANSAAMIADARGQGVRFYKAFNDESVYHSVEGEDGKNKDVIFDVKRIELVKRYAAQLTANVSTGKVALGDKGGVPKVWRTAHCS